MLEDHKAVILEGKIEIAKNAVKDWMECDRDTMITSMLDAYSQEKYEKQKEKADEAKEPSEESGDPV